jgi:hypothetical protein
MRKNMRSIKLAIALSSAIAPFVAPCLAQSQAEAASAPLQQKLQAFQQATAENERRLHAYEWIETSTVTINGSPKPPRQSICRYTPYRTTTKTPLGPQQEQPRPRGGPFRQMIEEKKIHEMEESLAQVRELTARYLPLRQGAVKTAFETRKVDFEHDGQRGSAIVINDYVKPGDLS